AAAAAVTDAVGAGAVPGHADEQGPIVTEVRRPPVLRVGHERGEILLQSREVEALELLGVVEVLAHRIGLGRMLVQDVQSQLVGPPVAVRLPAASGGIERALCFGLLVTHRAAPIIVRAEEESLLLRVESKNLHQHDGTWASWPPRRRRR